jgi:hypothetical protein
VFFRIANTRPSAVDFRQTWSSARSATISGVLHAPGGAPSWCQEKRKSPATPSDQRIPTRLWKRTIEPMSPGRMSVVFTGRMNGEDHERSSPSECATHTRRPLVHAAQSVFVESRAIVIASLEEFETWTGKPGSMA